MKSSQHSLLKKYVLWYHFPFSDSAGGGRLTKRLSLFTAAALLAAVLGLNACHKDPTPQTGNTTATSIALRSEGSGYTPEQQAALQAHLEAIANFRTQVHAWRNEPTGDPMPAAEVIEKTEIAFNLYQGNPTVPFESYESIEQDLPVSANETWTPAQIVDFYDAVKAIAVQALSSSTHRHLHVLVLSNPEEQEGGTTVVRLMLQVGINPLEEPDNAPLQTTRWAKAPKGYTHPTPCDGAADNVIGARVNQLIGFYLPINEGPETGNTPLPGRVVSRIVYGVHQLFNTPYNPPLPFPKVYDISTFGTNLQNKHYNSIAYGGHNPTWNCLTGDEINQLITANRIDLANNGKQYVPPVKIVFPNIGPLFFERKLVCTRVRADNDAKSEHGLIYQEHITKHYFGLVVFFELPPQPFPMNDM